MRINEYINSMDIRNYWDEIGYKPSAPEAAWPIWQGKNQILYEKHDPWKELMSEICECQEKNELLTYDKVTLCVEENSN